jgi:acetyl esterase/lipase
MQRIGLALAFLLLWGAAVAAGPPPAPTHADARYSDAHARSTLDIWLTDGERPAPLVIYFHGGGFENGDKRQAYRHPLLARCRRDGIAFATVNYPLLPDMAQVAIMHHCLQAIQFLKEKAEVWRLDPQRFAVAGVSAGAAISEYLAYTKDVGITVCGALQQPMGTMFLLPFINAGDPPLVVHTTAPPSDNVHHPSNTAMLKAHCDKVGVPCEVWGGPRNDLPRLPKGESFVSRFLAACETQWKRTPDE